MSRVQFLAGAGAFFSAPSHPDWFQGPSSHLTNEYWRVLPWGYSSWGCEADHSSPSSAELKNAWIYTPTPPNVFRVWYLAQYTSSRHGAWLSTGTSPLPSTKVFFTLGKQEIYIQFWLERIHLGDIGTDNWIILQNEDIWVWKTMPNSTCWTKNSFTTPKPVNKDTGIIILLLYNIYTQTLTSI